VAPGGGLQQGFLSLAVPRPLFKPVAAAAAAAATAGAADAAAPAEAAVEIALPAAAAAPAPAAASSGAAPTPAPPPALPATLRAPAAWLPRLQFGWSYEAPAPAADAAAGTGLAGAAAPRVYAAEGAPELDALLAGYAAAPTLRAAGGSVLVPVGAAAALRSLLALSSGRLVLLAGDKGYSRLCELEGLRDPHVALHGAVSFMVNFHALRALAKARGAACMQTPAFEGFKSAAFFFDAAAGGAAAPAAAPAPAFVFSDGEDAADLGLGAEEVGSGGFRAALAALSAPAPAPAPAAAPYPLTRVAVADNLTAGFSVDDFSTLQRAIKDECGEPSLKLVLALVRLANHDADVFYKFKRTLIEQTPAAPADTVLKDVRADVDRLFAANYPLQRGKDVCFECGRLLMGVRDYAAAADFFHRSNELCGEHHVTFHNMGICYFYLVRAGASSAAAAKAPARRAPLAAPPTAHLPASPRRTTLTARSSASKTR
jgi:hypothetical protein